MAHTQNINVRKWQRRTEQWLARGRQYQFDDQLAIIQRSMALPSIDRGTLATLLLSLGILGQGLRVSGGLRVTRGDMAGWDEVHTGMHYCAVAVRMAEAAGVGCGVPYEAALDIAYGCAVSDHALAEAMGDRICLSRAQELTGTYTQIGFEPFTL